MIWWMLQNFIVTAILAGCVWAVCRIGRIGPACQHALWLVLLVKLITPPLVSWPWAISEVTVPLSTSPPSTPHSSPRAVRAVFASVPERALVPSVATRSSDWLGDWLIPTVASVWLSGCAIFVLMQGKRIRVMLRLFRTAVPADSELLALVAEAARRVRTRAVDTRVASGIASPFIWCIHRPRLLWPAALSKGVPEEAIRGLLVHELAHIKRKDHWGGWLELAAGCLWWWNPLYWFIRHQLRENAELACDAWVVDAMESTPSGRRAYAEALLAVCESISSPMTAIGANTSSRRFLERRLTMILRERFPLRLSRAGIFIVALIAAATLPTWSLEAAPEGTVAQAAGARTEAPATPAAQDLPGDAQELLKQFEARQAEVRRTTEATLGQQRRQLIDQLQSLQDTHTKAGRLDEALAVRDQVRRLQGIAPADAIAHYVNRVGQNIVLNSDTKIPFTIKVIRSDGINAVSLPGGFYYVDTGLILAADEEAKLAGAMAGEIARVMLAAKNGQVLGIEGNIAADKLTITGGVRGSIGPQGETIFITTRSNVFEPSSRVAEMRGRNGETLELEATGSTEGTIWGSGVYTDDSSVETAAVHAGLLKPGERGTIRVTILPGRSSYEGSLRHGVRSQPFDEFDGSYRMERIK